MAKISTFETVCNLHKAGQFAQAEQGYRAILRKNPRHVEALHALGILYTQQGKWDDAVPFLQKAMKYDTKNPAIALHLANVLKLQNLFQPAEKLLIETLKTFPHYLPALHNLGIVYYAQGQFAKAAQAYQTVISQQPEYIDAYYNLGLALQQQAQFTEAAESFQQLLHQAPEHFAARFQLGRVRMQQEKFDAAIEIFLAVENNYPHHFETQCNLATCYLHTSQLAQACEHYQKALALTPTDTQILFNLGIIYTQLGQLDTAIQYYQKALQIDADLFAAHNNIGVAFLAKHHVPFALQHFQEAARIQPHNAAVNYAVTMLSQHQRLPIAPPDYIQSLFDSYADHYEQHLLSALDYQVHTQLYQAVLTLRQPLPHSLDIVDLGCGTGLCGTLFKPFAKSLIGVDLSEKMLALASEKAIYTELVHQDLAAFLVDKIARYDLLISGDVLVYIGDLASLLQTISQALRPQGLFAFNTEVSTGNDYVMNQSGRFAHQKKYIDALATQHQLRILFYQPAVTRLQNNQPVTGHIYVLQKIN